jgi:hypothetical protein
MAVLDLLMSFVSPVTCSWRLVHNIRPTVRPVKSRFVINSARGIKNMPPIDESGNESRTVVAIPNAVAIQKLLRFERRNSAHP